MCANDSDSREIFSIFYAVEPSVQYMENKLEYLYFLLLDTWKKIQKISVALANADGGDFIVGIKEDKEEVDPMRRWCGASNKKFFNLADCRSKIPTKMRNP